MAKDKGNRYEESLVCLEEFSIPPEQSFGFISFNFMVNLCTTVDKNGSMTWSVTQDKISILYYFNDENINLENILSFLSTFARTYGLNSQGWKLPFTMPVSNSEHRNYDYFKRIEFICKKLFFYFFSFLLINNAKLQRDFCLLRQCTSLLLFF